MAAPSRTSFSLQGKNLKLDTAADIEPHLEELRAIENLEEIHLGGNTLGVGACQALAKELEQKRSLKVADFADIFTGRLISEIPSALRALCDALVSHESLVEINLSDNAFGGRSAEPMVNFLENNHHFSVLKLNNNGLGIEGGTIVAKALLRAAEKLKTDGGKPSQLRTIICGRNRLENGSAPYWAQAFAAHGGLEEVRMFQNGIRMEGIQELTTKGLAFNPNLRVLDLQDNTATLKGSRAIAACLACWPKLQELNLSELLLKPKGGQRIFATLAQGSNPALKTLQVNYCDLDRTALTELSSAIEGHLKELEHVDINGNWVDEEDDCIEAIKKALAKWGHENALQELDEMDPDGEEEEEDEGEDEGEEKTEEDQKAGDEKKEDSEGVKTEPLAFTPAAASIEPVAKTENAQPELVKEASTLAAASIEPAAKAEDVQPEPVKEAETDRAAEPASPQPAAAASSPPAPASEAPEECEEPAAESASQAEESTADVVARQEQEESTTSGTATSMAGGAANKAASSSADSLVATAIAVPAATAALLTAQITSSSAPTEDGVEAEQEGEQGLDACIPPVAATTTAAAEVQQSTEEAPVTYAEVAAEVTHAEAASTPISTPEAAPVPAASAGAEEPTSVLDASTAEKAQDPIFGSAETSKASDEAADKTALVATAEPVAITASEQPVTDAPAAQNDSNAALAPAVNSASVSTPTKAAGQSCDDSEVSKLADKVAKTHVSKHSQSGSVDLSGELYTPGNDPNEQPSAAAEEAKKQRTWKRFSLGAVKELLGLSKKG
ncbi:RNI-like protein [Tilletiaria anomala UBC 951]|uniref:RNI-like protein n=1 Tax=Tilletiaria anomala (strain ATCC 24038 / CBS 436.72 / UBC 951) TaxID=1037660 RepID=A0A066VY49_TILAU|nr:RNI-like protein [Tilletiaria anomala UBC 951]KDN45218.1 RNI-like protein [Tilletiaria anomala UBC 951]